MPAAPDSLLSLLQAFPGLEASLRGIERAAASEAPILLLGEPGTGRTTLARTLHAASPRNRGPRIEVDPALMPPSLFESELFGHAVGAFTGADAARAGRAAEAEGGTLVLDHVEELPLGVQPKLLRFLSERRYTPLGGVERVADVRILAIGSADLHRRLEAGAFRADLFYRLEVLAFRVPPLRERASDLPAICRRLLDDLAERFGRSRLVLSPTAERWMASYSWPGNLRELRNLLERQVILSQAIEIDPKPLVALVEEVPRSLAAVEREQILRALAYARGHQGRAAELLGISRKALWEKRRRFGIP